MAERFLPPVFFAAFFAVFFAAFFLAAMVTPKSLGLKTYFFAVRFLAPAFFAVLPAAFFVVFVFFAPAFFLAAIRVSSCRGDLHDVYGHLRYLSKKKLDG